MIFHSSKKIQMDDRIDITPDLYSRNIIISTIVNKYRDQNKRQTLRILDVGGRNGHLQEFLPKDEITILDIREGSEKNLIVGDATDMRTLFKDHSFDIVTSGDVFEHIPQEKRERFVKECIRVSSDLVIIAAPFDDPETGNAEKIARNYFKQFAGKDHEWLTEHIENGLPSLNGLIDLIESENLKSKILYSNEMENWMLFQLTSFASYWQNTPNEKIKEIYEFYNTNIENIDDPTKSFYRKIVILSKKPININWEYEFKPNLKIKFIDKCISLISESSKNIIEDKNTHIKNLSDAKDLLDTTTKELQRSLDDLNRENQNLVKKGDKLKSQKEQLESQKELLESQKEQVVQKLEQEHAFSQTLTKQIHDKNVHIGNIEAELTKIKGSKMWKLLKIYKVGEDIIRHPKQKITRLVRSIKNIGIKATVKNVLAKFQIKQKKQIQELRSLSINEQYKIWLQQNQITKKNLEQKRSELEDFKYTPTISIIMPVYNVDEKWLRKAIESVRNQIYENWELCINDDASTAKHIKPALKEYAKNDKRIKVKYSTKNQHISGSSNEALKLATGEFIALMDNDDEIAPDALFEVAKVLNENKNLDFIYSDEDKLDENGDRVEPFFKPDWSPDYFMSTMYTCHLGVYRKSLIDKVGGFRKGYEGSQDYDLVLRVTELTKNIYHIPQILYHWRKIEGSTSSEYSDKSYAKISAKKALEDVLRRRSLSGKIVQGKTPESFRMKYDIKDNPLVSILIPTWNKKDILQRCIESIESKTDYKNYELLIIDNRSDEQDAIEYLKQLSKKHRVIKYNKPFNFSAINNFAVKKAKGDYILFLNNDTEIINTEWLSAMLEQAQRESIGAVGAKLVYPNGQLQHGGVILGIGNNGVDGIAGHANKYMNADQGNFTDLSVYKNRINQICNFSAVTAACLMTRKEVFEKVGGFNEKDLTIAFNDVDLCLKIRKSGYNIVYTPYAELYHHESISRGGEDDPEKQARFARECEYMLKTWGNTLRNDPYYNPNLTKAHEDYSLDIK